MSDQDSSRQRADSRRVQALRKLLDDALLKAFRHALPEPGDASIGVTLCSACGRFKVSQRRWVYTPDVLGHGFPAAVSHGMCPDCIRALYPEHADELLQMIQ